MIITLDVERDVMGLDEEIANSIWQTLVYSAPYDTGNLRSAIRKSASNEKRILFVYDENQARYLDFLERGVGPIKKYKNFISGHSMNEATKEVVYWLKTGNITFGGVPTVVLKGRLKGKKSDGSGKPIGYEKQFMKNKDLVLTAKERSSMSKLYVKQEFGELFKVKGERVNVEISPMRLNRASNVKRG